MMGIDLISDWAKKHNVVLFVLPPYTSHLTQPLDVGAFGPLKSMYSKECQMYLQKHPGFHLFPENTKYGDRVSYGISTSYDSHYR
jgi:hypothetical protein